MTKIKLNLSNFSQKDKLLSIFREYANDFEYTSDGVFRRIVPPRCPVCGTWMNHNGYNTYRKKNLGSVRIGRYVCPFCGCTAEEERSFWEKMKDEIFSFLDQIYHVLMNNHLSSRGSSDVMSFIFPGGKDMIYNAFNRSVEMAEIPSIRDIKIVHYDEQHSKAGRAQKYRLTLLDHSTAQPIAEELCENKNKETIRSFLEKHLDPGKPTFVVTDIANGYPSIFKDFFGKNLTLQLCYCT
jgi:transposase